MNQFKHTKGPWHYQEESDAYTHIVRTESNGMISHLSQDTSGESEANARLIATSPEMLVILIENYKLISKISDNESAVVFPRELRVQMESNWNITLDIIEKATGLKIKDILEK